MPDAKAEDHEPGDQHVSTLASLPATECLFWSVDCNSP